MSASQIQAGKAYVAIYGDLSPLRQDLKKLTPELRKQGDQLVRIGESTAAAFSKGTAEIVNATEGTKAAAIQFNIAAIASNSFGQSSVAALASTAESSKTTATATQKLVEQMNEAKPASKGFTTALSSLKSMDVTLASGAFGVSSIITLLKGGGPATKPLLDAMQGIVGKAKQLEQIKTPPIIAKAAGIDWSRMSQGGFSSPATSNTGQRTTTELAGMFNQTNAKILAYLKGVGIHKIGKAGSSNLYDQSVIEELKKHFGDPSNASKPKPAKSIWESFKDVMRGTAKGSSVGMNGGEAASAMLKTIGSAWHYVSTGARQADGETTKYSNGMNVLRSAAGAAFDIVSGGLFAAKTSAQLAAAATTNVVGGLVGIKGAFAPVFGQMSALQKVANSAQWTSLFFGSKQQRHVAKQMGIEADAAAIGEAFARGWVPGFLKYARLGIPRAIASSIRGAASLPGMALGGIAASLFAGKGKAAEVDHLGNVSEAVAPKLGVLQKGIEKVRDTAKSSSTVINSLASNIGGILAGGLGVVSTIGRLAGGGNSGAHDRIASIGHSATTQKRSVKSTSELEFAAKSTGTSLKTLDSAFDHLGTVISSANDGSEKAIEKFNALGLSAESLGKMPIDKKMDRIGAALAQIKDPLERDRLAIELLGESGGEVTSMLTDLNGLRSKANSSGAIVSEKDIEAAKKMKLAMDGLKATLSNAWNQIGAASIKSTTQWVSGAVKFLDKNQAVVESLLKIVAGVGAAAGGLVLWNQYGGPVVTVIKSIGIAVAALMNPIGLVAVGIGAGVAAWMYFTESGRAAATQIGGMLSQFFTFFQEVWGGIVSAIGKGDLALAGKIAWTGLQLGFLEALHAMGGSWSAVMETVYGAAQFVSDAVSSAWEFATGAIANGQSNLEKYFLMSFENIGAAWEEMCLDMQIGLAPAQNWVAKSFALMAENARRMLTGEKQIMADNQADMAAFYKTQDEVTKGNLIAVRAEKKINHQKFSPVMQQSIKENEEKATKANEARKQVKQDAFAAHQKTLEDRMAALKPDDVRMADLKKELAESMAEAKSMTSDPAKKPPAFVMDTPQLAGDKSAAVAGTFNAAAAGGLGGGGPAEQIARSTAETVALLKEDKAAKRQLYQQHAQEKRQRRDDQVLGRRLNSNKPVFMKPLFSM